MMTRMGLSPWALLFFMVIGFVSSDLNKDRAECADQLVGLATCLPYAGGDAKAPTIDCCSGLKQVLQKSKKCLCVLVKDRNDPNLGLKINATLALGLPSACHAPTSISDCVDLLHLAPSSPDAKVFYDFDKSLKERNSTQAAPGKEDPTDTGSSSQLKSDGGKGKKWSVVGVMCGALVWCFSSYLTSSL